MKKTPIAFTACLLVALTVVPAMASAPSEDGSRTPSTDVSGTWSWVNTGWDVWRHDDGTKYVAGTEDGTWTGTFEGSSLDSFGGTLRPDGSLWGLLTISFEGTVEGRTGSLQIATTWVVPKSDPGEAMTGKWVIVAGTDELVDLHGHGTWVYLGADPTNHADYEGSIKFGS